MMGKDKQATISIKRGQFIGETNIIQDGVCAYAFNYREDLVFIVLLLSSCLIMVRGATKTPSRLELIYLPFFIKVVYIRVMKVLFDVVLKFSTTYYILNFHVPCHHIFIEFQTNLMEKWTCAATHAINDLVYIYMVNLV